MNSTIRVYFHRSRGIFPWLIRLWTGNTFDHTEVGFPDGVRLKVLASGVRMEMGGVRPAAAVTIVVDPAQQLKARAVADSMVGAAYDWQGIAGQAVHALTENPERWFCSEAAARVLAECGVQLAHPCEWYSPARLAVELCAA